MMAEDQKVDGVTQTNADAKPPESPLPASAEAEQQNIDQGPPRTGTEGEPVALAGLLEEVRTLLKDRLAYDATKEQMFQALHTQLQEYKSGFVDRMQGQALKALVGLYDGIVRLDKAVRAQTCTVDAIRMESDVLKSEAEEALYRLDVVPFSDHPERLDRRMHKTVRVVDTGSPEEDNAIAEIARVGLMRGDTVLRPEEVVVKRYRSQKGG
jgi:molecular chaperone GrpE (heat shock protein)